MKTLLKVVGGFVGLIVLIVVLVSVFSSGARDTAKQFVIQASSGQIEEARALLHPGLREKLGSEQFSAMFEGAQAYEKVTFSSVSTGTGKPTDLEGTAKTALGCTSTVAISLLNGQIVSFDISPLCR